MGFWLTGGVPHGASWQLTEVGTYTSETVVLMATGGSTEETLGLRLPSQRLTVILPTEFSREQYRWLKGNYVSSVKH